MSSLDRQKGTSKPQVVPDAVSSCEAGTAHRLILEAGTDALSSNGLFRHLVEVANEGVWIVDSECRTVFANPQLARLFATTVQGMIGRSLWDFIFPEDRADQEEQIRNRKQGRSESFERRFRRADGKEVWTLVSACPMQDRSGGYAGSFAMLSDLTARKRTEAALLRTSQELDRFFSVSLDLFLICDLAGTILRVNEAWEEALGYPPGDLPGRRLDELLHPDDLEATRHALEALADGVALDGLVNRCRRKDGSYRWIEWRASITQGNQVCAAARDITSRLKYESELREQSAFRKAIIDRAADGLCVYHSIPGFPYAQFTVWNQRMTEITGYTLEEVNELGWYQTVYSERQREKRAKTQHRYTAFEDSVNAGEWEITRKDGTRRIVTISTSLVTSQDGRPHVLALVHDRTGQKHEEDERRRLERQVQHVQKLESLGLLAGGIAHDFNNLLMAIMGNTELALLEIALESSARSYLEDVGMASRRASELCGQLLAYAGKGRFVVEPLDLNRVVEQLARMIEVSLSKKASLEYRLAEALPAIEADITQVNQILMNLLTNASDAIGNRSGLISITTGTMEVDREYLSTCCIVDNIAEGLYVYLEVSDNGCGMSPEVQSRIFDPFFSTKFTGRGLGMAAALGIVRGHRGTIRIDSKENEGTSIRILFPASSKTPRFLDSTPRVAPEWQGSGTILVVEDEEPIRILTCNLLARMGFRTIRTRDGLQAIATYREKGKEIDAVLLDLTMPGLDGEETFLALREIDPKVRVILCSGYDRLDVSRRFSGKGLAGFVQKPYQISTLRETLQQVLHKPAQPLKGSS